MSSSRWATFYQNAHPSLVDASALTAFRLKRPWGDQLLGIIFLHAVDDGDRFNPFA